MKTWECIECGYLFEGHKPPRHCPDCEASQYNFELLEDDPFDAEELEEDWEEEWDELDEDWDDDFDDDFDLDDWDE